MSAPATIQPTFHVVTFNPNTKKAEWQKTDKIELNEESVLILLDTVEKNIDSLATDVKTVEHVQHIYTNFLNIQLQTQSTSLKGEVSDQTKEISTKYELIITKITQFYTKQKTQSSSEDDDEFEQITSFNKDFVPRLQKPKTAFSAAPRGIEWYTLNSETKKTSAEKVQKYLEDGLFAKRPFYQCLIQKNAFYTNVLEPIISFFYPFAIYDLSKIWKYTYEIVDSWKKCGGADSDIDFVFNFKQMTWPRINNWYDFLDRCRVFILELQLMNFSVVEVLTDAGKIDPHSTIAMKTEDLDLIYKLEDDFSSQNLAAQKVQFIDSIMNKHENILGPCASKIPGEIKVLIFYILLNNIGQIKKINNNLQLRLGICNQTFEHKLINWLLEVSENFPRGMFNFILKTKLMPEIHDEREVFARTISNLEKRSSDDSEDLEDDTSLSFYKKLNEIANSKERIEHCKIYKENLKKIGEHIFDTITSKHSIQSYLPLIKAIIKFTRFKQEYAASYDLRKKDPQKFAELQAKLIHRLNKLLTAILKGLATFGKEAQARPEYLEIAPKLDEFISKANIPISIVDTNFLEWFSKEISKYGR